MNERNNASYEQNEVRYSKCEIRWGESKMSEFFKKKLQMAEKRHLSVAGSGGTACLAATMEERGSETWNLPGLWSEHKASLGNLVVQKLK